MKKIIKTFEKFTRPDLIDGLELVGKMDVNDFMSHLADNDLDTKGKVFRLVEYTPQPDRWLRQVKVVTNPDTGKEERMEVLVPDSRQPMFKSPFVIFPGNFYVVSRYFIKTGADAWKRYTGKFPEKKGAVEQSVTMFNAVSISAMSNAFLEDEFVHVLETIFDGTTNPETKTKVSKCTRNYTGYNFDSVLIYEIDDPEDAAIGIAEEVYETPWDR